MKEKKNNWLIGEMVFLLLAPFMVLAGILIYGILFDRWFKDPELILKASMLYCPACGSSFSNRPWFICLAFMAHFC